MTTLHTAFDAALPDWLVDELEWMPQELPTAESRAALVNELADRNWRAGNGGPFAALVVDRLSGALVGVGVNVVLATGLSSLHAEVMALTLAQRGVGRWDLGTAIDGSRADLELVVNWRPCVMCYGAAMWSGVRALAICGDGPECEELTGFDEGPVVADWAEQFAARGIEVSIGTGRDAAVEVFRAYRDGGATVYNPSR